MFTPPKHLSIPLPTFKFLEITLQCRLHNQFVQFTLTVYNGMVWYEG